MTTRETIFTNNKPWKGWYLVKCWRNINALFQNKVVAGKNCKYVLNAILKGRKMIGNWLDCKMFLIMNILGRNYLHILDVVTTVKNFILVITDKIDNLSDLLVINQNQIGI